jgi:hypothetical protein
MRNPETRKKYLEANKEKIKEQKKQYYEKNKVEYINTVKSYQSNNREKIRQYNKNRRKTDELFKLKGNLKCLIRNSIIKEFTKQSKTEEILGCSFEQFKQYLESQFESWMNWDNYGLYNGELNYGWDIDHIIPLASAITLDDIIKLNHYTNLQPLCSYTNRCIKKNNML